MWRGAGERDRGPLHLTADSRHVEVVTTLVELGADVYAEAADGSMPLHHGTQRTR
jgi:ankyrin repeat protein